MLTLALFGWSLVEPLYASVSFCVLIGLIDVYLFYIDMAAKPEPDHTLWTEIEVGIIRRYHVYFRYPLGARIFSTILNGTRWTAILLWVPWLLWNALWIPAGAIGVHFFITSGLSVRLDPITHFSQAIRSGNMQFAGEAQQLQSIMDKLEKLSHEVQD